MDIRVYRISTCHWCDKVESFLKKYDIKYRSIVVDLMAGDDQEKAITEAYHLSKQRSFPVTYIDGTCVIGFHESRLRRLLKLPVPKEEKEEIQLEGLLGKGSSFLEYVVPHETIENMKEWLLREAKSHGYTINPDQHIVEEILTGLAINEKRYGYKACPCRLATGKYQLDCDIICPCSYCFMDVEKNGRCYCSLFVTDRYISGDPSLPQYIPDSRERVEISGKTVVSIQENTDVIAAKPAALFKTHIKAIGFVQDEADKNKAKEGFLKIITTLDADASAVQWHESAAYASTAIHDTKVVIKMKQDTDSYTYQIACMAPDGKAINGENLFQKINLSHHKNKLFECYIIGAKKNENVHQYLPPEEKRYISNLYKNYRIVAGFDIEGANIDTFIVNTDDNVPDKIVEDIVMLEANYHLLSVERQRYILAVDKLDLLESKIVAKMSTISMNLPKSLPEMLKGWLHELSNNFGEISGITEESRHHMNYTILKRDAIRRIFNYWDEKNDGFSYPVVSKFFLGKVDSLGDQYQSLFIRIDGIRREMTDLITILRTKIDLLLQEQSLELQRSVDETTKTQMMMQHTVEGLSVIVLSYYTIHLAGFIFESMEASHIINISLTTAKAIFVPIAIAISWFLTFRARRFMKRYSHDKSK